jgi:sorting nexin-29
MSDSQTEYYGPQKYVENPKLSMIYNAIKRLKKNRAPGEDRITAELLKYGGRNLWRRIYNLITIIWENEEMPADWQTAVICPIYKKANKLQCENYRGISLLNVKYKLFTNIVTQHLETYTEETIGDYQCGFRKGRSTNDQIFTLRQIIKKTYELNVQIHQLFIEFKQAYNSINHQELYIIVGVWHTNKNC